MSFSINGKTKGTGTPIPKAGDDGDQQATETKVRKMHFADWVSCGKNPRDGMELPNAELTDLTRELIEKCLNAGMSISEIARKFSAKYKDVYNRCYRAGLVKPLDPPAVDEPVSEKPAQYAYEIVEVSPEAIEQFFAEDPAPVIDDPIDEEVMQKIIEYTLPTIKDSGQRTEFSTGAVRDMQEGKGRLDLCPWGAIMELSKHCEAGAIKYGERNIDKGLPISCLINSALRHLAKYLMGFRDEDHAVAALWNLAWAVQFERYKPDMQDIPSRMQRP